MRIRTGAGFTLVELLVVIGVIGILMGLLMPALSQARYQARVTQCAATLQQIGQAENIYASDNKGRFLRIDAAVNTGCNGWDVSNGMYQAMREQMALPHAVLFCPDSPEELVAGVWSQFNPEFKILGYSWWTPRTMGGILFPPAEPTASGLLVADPKSAGPERQGDRNSNDVPIVTDSVITVGNLPWPQADSATAIWSTHRRGGRPDVQNQLYADGHVERKSWSELTTRYARDTNGNWQWR